MTGKLLSVLLDEVEKLFGNSLNNQEFTQHTYSLNRTHHPEGWSFTVIDDWHKWLEKGLQTEFGIYLYPEQAIAGFLRYVTSKKINVKKLRYKENK